MLLSSILTTFGGALFGGVQNFLQEKQQHKANIEIAKIEAEKELKIAEMRSSEIQNEVTIEKERSSASISSSNASIANSQTEEYKAFADAVKTTSALWENNSQLALISNFITTTLRPFVTYLLMFSVVGIAFILIKNGSIDGDNKLEIFHVLLMEFSAVMSYWFVRRSYEKNLQQPFSLKKKLKNNENDAGKYTNDTNSYKQLKYTDTNAIDLATNIIKKWEGLRLKAYKCSAGVWTIGYGHTKTAKENMIITNEQAETLLYQDIEVFYNAVNEETGKICNKNQVAALTSFAFNVGINAFKRSTLLKRIKSNPQNFKEIEEQFMRWNKVGNIVIRGLTNRRKDEFELYKK